MDIVKKVKEHFFKVYEKSGCKIDYPEHVRLMIKLIDKFLKQFPEADREVLLISAWFHDIGDVLYGETIDHAVSSEKEARKFLEENNYDKNKIEQVAHCIRAHRNKDVRPETVEAKMIAVVDSASHFLTAGVYIGRLNKGRDALSKLERDYADFDLLPGIKQELTPLYQAWKKLIEVYPKL